MTLPGRGMIVVALLAATLLTAGLCARPGAATPGGPGSPLTIESPASGQVLHTTSLVVVGSARDTGGGPPAVEVRVNGGPWVSASLVARAEGYAWRAPVQIQPGENRIDARLATGSSAPAETSVTVTFDPLPPPPIEVTVALAVAGVIAVPVVSILLKRRFSEGD